MKNKKLLIAVLVVWSIAFLGFAGCAPSEPAPADTADDSTSALAVQGEWSVGNDCAACHTKKDASFEDSGCLASKHTASTCSNCHTNEESLKVAHEEATADSVLPKKLSKDNKVSEEVCLSCHVSWEDLAQKTQGNTVLTDLKGTVVNPHDLPEGHTDNLDCTDCHVVHKARNLDQNSQDACLSCHHSGDYECGTCHTAH